MMNYRNLNIYITINSINSMRMEYRALLVPRSSWDEEGWELYTVSYTRLQNENLSSFEKYLR